MKVQKEKKPHVTKQSTTPFMHERKNKKLIPDYYQI